VPVYEIEGKRPRIGAGTWVAPSAEIIGDVEIGENCYIGFGAVIRGDFGKITIGDESLVESDHSLKIILNSTPNPPEDTRTISPVALKNSSEFGS